MATEIIKSHDFKTMLHPHKKNKRARQRQCQSVGIELDIVEGDKVTKTNVDENKRRRTLILQRADHGTWGFTLQSYGIHHRDTKDVEILTYVDYVEHGGPGFVAGLQQGDVILSINGTNMEDADHNALVQFIKCCGSTMRVVVLFEDCCRKVELHLRYIRLKRVLAEKIFEVRSLEQQEKRVLVGMSRFDSRRSSITSSLSSLSSVFDDRLSLQYELDTSSYRRTASCSDGTGDESLQEGTVIAAHAREMPISPLAREPPDADLNSHSMNCGGQATLPEPSPFMRDCDSMSSLTSIKSAQPFFGPRFDFDRASLPVNNRLKPQLRSQTFICHPGSNFSPAKKPTSMRLDRSVLLRDVLSPEFQKGIPEDGASSLRRHASTPENIGDTNDVDLYKYCINNNARLHGYSDENLSGKHGVRPKEKKPLLPIPVLPSRRRRYHSEEIKTQADVHSSSKLNASASVSELKSELRRLPLKACIGADILMGHGLIKSASEELIGTEKIQPEKFDSYSADETKSGLDLCDIVITFDESGDICDDSKSTDSSPTHISNGANQDVVDPADIVFSIGEPIRSSSPDLFSPDENLEHSEFLEDSSLHSPEENLEPNAFLEDSSLYSPEDNLEPSAFLEDSSLQGDSSHKISSTDDRRSRGHSSLSALSRFSYSDLPCMDVVFVNERDEVSKL